jgi:hypothetical protein
MFFIAYKDKVRFFKKRIKILLEKDRWDKTYILSESLSTALGERLKLNKH